MNFKKMSLEKQKKTFLNARDEYHNNEEQSFLTDGEYDALEDLIRAADPEWKPLHETGVRIRDGKDEVALERFMPSLEKAYPEDVPRFLNRQVGGTWAAMDKLDGTSLQLKYVRGYPKSLRTRGDGTLGRDVSHMIPMLVTYGRIPKQIGSTVVTIFRLEGVIKKKVFERCWSRAVLGKKGFDNARQAANGAFLRKAASPILRDIDLVVLGMYEAPLVQGLKAARDYGFKVVYYVNNFVPSRAEDLLAVRKEASEYAIDGLVLAHSSFSMEFEDAEKPKNAFAFKINNVEDAFELLVNEIQWKKTRLKRWQPKIKVDPTEMDGVIVTQATAHNPAWMIDKGIGPGAVVKVLRSGGVIPKIVGVVKPAKFVGPPGPYEARGRFFYMLEADKASDVRGIHFFMTTLGIELFAQKTIEKLYDVGYTSISVYIEASHMTKLHEDCCKVLVKAGVGENQSRKLIKELSRVLNDTLALKKLMVASGCFDAGMGERKLSQIEAAGISMRELCNMKYSTLIEELLDIKGFKEKTAKNVADGIAKFKSWYRPLKHLLTVDGHLPEKREKKKVAGVLSGVNVSFTGYRDAVREQLIVQLGGEVIAFGAKTTVLLYDPAGKSSTKIVKAGARAMTWQEFAFKYQFTQHRISA
jgi:NAD-dependent DNA ligase